MSSEGKSAEDYEIEGDKFLIQWAEMKHPKGHLSLDTLWNTKTKENAIVSHRYVVHRPPWGLDAGIGGL